MLTLIKTALTRSPETFVQDILGACALIVMLMAGLHLPAFV